MYLVDDLPDIVAVLKHYGANINRSSGQVNVKCPFHNDSHASASFNTRQNIFNCFGHEQYTGRLSIPYITKTGVVDLRFRSLNPAVEPKYMGMVGVDTRMYNVLDIEYAGDWIGVCEGELDTLTMSRLVGVPCIGVPGANSWKKHYTRLLADFERIFVFADGDAPGREFAASLARELPVTTITFGDGEDVNSAYIRYGASFIKEKMGLNID